MKTEHKAYLASIGIEGATQLARIDEILGWVTANGIMTDVDEMFVEDRMEYGGTRIYDTLNLYSADRLFTAVEFLHTDQFRVARTQEKLRGLEISGDFDFQMGKANARSTLRVEAYAPGNALVVTAQATGKNCETLHRITMKYFLPNVEP